MGVVKVYRRNKCLILSLLFLLHHTLCPVAFGAGNETFNAMPDPGLATFKTLLQTFLRNELPAVLTRLQPTDMVMSGGLHGTSNSCTVSAIAVDGYTTAGNHVTADSASGTVAINYAAPNLGCTACSSGTKTAWTVASGANVSTLPGSNFQRFASSNFYVDCISTVEPALPADATWLMGPITITNGAVTAVTDRRSFTPQIPSIATAQLPTPGRLGRLTRLTDTVRGFWVDTGTQWARLDRVIDARRDFNMVCDGTTPNQDVPLQAALTAAGGSKVPAVYVPQGVCLLGAGVTVPAGVSLFGSGADQSVLKPSMTSGVVLTLASASSPVLWGGFGIDGSTASGTASAIYLSGVSRLTMVDVTVSNFTSTSVSAFKLDGASTTNLFQKLRLTNNALGFFAVATSGTVYPQLQTFRSCEFDSAPTGGQYTVRLQNVAHFVFDGCLFTGNKTLYTVWVDVPTTVTQPQTSHIFRNNRFIDNGQQVNSCAVNVAGSASQLATRVTIDGNHFVQSLANAPQNQICLSQSDRTVVTNNSANFGSGKFLTESSITNTNFKVSNPAAQQSADLGWPAVQVRKSITQTLVASGTAKGTWDVVEQDTAHEFTTSNSRYTAKVTGLYRVDTVTTWDSSTVASASVSTQLFKNGSSPGSGWSAFNVKQLIAAAETFTMSRLIFLTSGDFLEVFFGEHTPTTSATVGVASTWSINLIEFGQ